MTVEAVIFDWGGTLTPWHDIDLVEQWSAYAVIYAPTDPELAQRLAEAELILWRRQQASRGADGTGSLEHIFESVGIDTTSTLHGEALAAYLEGWDPHTLADMQARPTMEALHDRGIRVGVLSNTMWPRWHHEAVFSRDGLAHLIDGAVYSSEIPYAKPHAAAFRAALDAVAATPSMTVFVGDRPWDDVHGAQEVGMRAVLMPHSNLGDQAVDIEVEPDAVITGLLELVDVIDRWRLGA